MGFSILFFFLIAILVPSTIILVVAWGVTKKKVYGKIAGIIWAAIFLFIGFLFFMNWWNSKIILDKEDYHGEYVIHRGYFKGEQADWQYNHFRFKITEQDSILFYETDGETILKTYRGTVRTSEYYQSARLVIDMEQPTHHILSGHPTTYRGSWDFYLVFRSPKFHNVFFKKGKWKSID